MQQFQLFAVIASEAKQSTTAIKSWIASELALLAMTTEGHEIP